MFFEKPVLESQTCSHTNEPGTEDGRILIVNPLKLSISKVFEINGTPLQIAPLGIMNVDYRIFVCSLFERIVQLTQLTRIEVNFFLASHF